MTIVRETMLADPPTLEVGDSAQDAGQALARPEVRAVFVCDGDRFVGVVTRKTLVREVVAAGRDWPDPGGGDRGGATLDQVDAEAPVDEAFRFMEEKDAERVPVVEERAPRGVLSRTASSDGWRRTTRRRPSRNWSSSRCRRREARRPRRALVAAPPRARCRGGCRAR